jgi:hypothetical protein
MTKVGVTKRPTRFLSSSMYWGSVETSFSVKGMSFSAKNLFAAWQSAQVGWVYMVISFFRGPNNLRNIVLHVLLRTRHLTPMLPALISLQNDLKRARDRAGGADLFAQAGAV